jgi:type IV secretory pathway VirB10-like protein
MQEDVISDHTLCLKRLRQAHLEAAHARVLVSEANRLAFIQQVVAREHRIKSLVLEFRLDELLLSSTFDPLPIAAVPPVAAPPPVVVAAAPAPPEELIPKRKSVETRPKKIVQPLSSSSDEDEKDDAPAKKKRRSSSSTNTTARAKPRFSARSSTGSTLARDVFHLTSRSQAPKLIKSLREDV